jgi:hypothetical protein
MKPEKDGHCELCKREVDLSFHHFIPKKMHSKRVVKMKFGKDFLDHYGCWVCNDCHKMIHRTFTHDQLAFEYNNLQLLKQYPVMSKFINWVKKQNKKVKR